MKWVTSRKFAAAVAAAAFLFEKGQYRLGTVVTCVWVGAEALVDMFGNVQAIQAGELPPDGTSDTWNFPLDGDDPEAHGH